MRSLEDRIATSSDRDEDELLALVEVREQLERDELIAKQALEVVRQMVAFMCEIGFTRTECARAIAVEGLLERLPIEQGWLE